MLHNAALADGGRRRMELGLLGRGEDAEIHDVLCEQAMTFWAASRSVPRWRDMPHAFSMPLGVDK
ncbi:MAG: hypothetical protein U5K75_06955 [Ahrensia sp.]|nr:hypothetical protein [Ahrensia sp.]